MKCALVFFVILLSASSGRGQVEEKIATPAVAQILPKSATNVTAQIELRRSQYSEKLTIPDEILSIPPRKRSDLLVDKSFAYTGAAVHIIKGPRQNVAQMIKHPLQLINPFAPIKQDMGDGRNAWND